MTEDKETKTPMAITAIRLPQQMLDELRVLAEKDDRSMSYIVRLACKELLAKPQT